MAYYQRLDDHHFQSNALVGGAWNVEEQHVAPVMGLLAHAMETDHLARRDDPLRLSRFSYDILGTIPLDIVRIDMTVIRPGRTIELVEGRLSHAGRTALVLRGWFTQHYATADLATTTLAPMAPPEEMAAWNPSSLWAGAFMKTLQVRRHLWEAGRAHSWLRTDVPLVEGERVSAMARAMGLVDVANGVAPLASPQDVAFPNLDLAAHFFREPVGDWLGLQSAVSIGPDGIGLTQSIIHDRTGPVGAASQLLTVRPRQP